MDLDREIDECVSLLALYGEEYMDWVYWGRCEIGWGAWYQERRN
jgi:hypothetical protein